MNVKVTLRTSYDSANTYNRDGITLESTGDDVTFTIGIRDLTVDKAELIAAVRIIEMAGGSGV